MPKFTYNGDHKNMQAFGLDFSKGKAAETKDSFTVAKLRGNSHFDEVDEKAGRKGAGKKESPLD